MTAWTESGIAYTMVAIANSDLIEVASMIRNDDEAAAHEQISSTIRQLEAARRMLT